MCEILGEKTILSIINPRKKYYKVRFKEGGSLLIKNGDYYQADEKVKAIRDYRGFGHLEKI